MKENESIKISGHHLAMLGEYIDGRELDEKFSLEYGKNFLDSVKKIYMKIILGDFKEIELCEGLDSICEICPIKKSECEISQSNEDMKNIKGYDLEKGKYSPKKILTKIKSFQEEHGWGSPRAKNFFWVY